MFRRPEPALLALANVYAYAQRYSAAELAAAREIESVKFMGAALKKCQALRDSAAKAVMTPEVRKDAGGRVMTIRTSTGVDVAFEYATNDPRPTAIVAGGKRTELALGAMTAREREAFEDLRAKAILYRAVKQLCGLEPPAPPANAQLRANAEPGLYCIECEGGDPLGGGAGGSFGWANAFGGWGGPMGSGGHGTDWIPRAWGEEDFWDAHWQPDYFAATSGPSVPGPGLPQECRPRCEAVCDIVAGGVGVACGVTAGYVGLANPPLGVAVGAACGSGTLVGLVRCKYWTCHDKCQ